MRTHFRMLYLHPSVLTSQMENNGHLKTACNFSSWELTPSHMHTEKQKTNVHKIVFISLLNKY